MKTGLSIRNISAYTHATVLITSSGELYVWGANQNRKFCSNIAVFLRPERVVLNFTVSSAQIQSDYMIMISDSGMVYFCGLGAVIRASTVFVEQPMVVPFVNQAYEQGIAYVRAAFDFIFMISKNNDIQCIGQVGSKFCSGSNGIDSSQLMGEKIRKVVASSYHVIILCDSGKVFGWGLNSNFELGRNFTESELASKINISYNVSRCPIIEEKGHVIDVAVTEAATYFIVDNSIPLWKIIVPSVIGGIAAIATIVACASFVLCYVRYKRNKYREFVKMKDSELEDKLLHHGKIDFTVDKSLYEIDYSSLKDLQGMYILYSRG